MNRESGLAAVELPAGFRERVKSIGTSSLTCEEIDRLRAGQINSRPGLLTGLDCPDCMNRGYFARVDAYGRRYNQECACMAKRRSLERIRRSGLEGLLARCTLDTWQTPEPWQRRARELALQYADKPGGSWFCMAGAVGSGKSHLCTALTGLLIERGFEARYMLWRDVSARAKAAVNDNVEYKRLVEPLKRVRVLYIDDLFKAGRDGWGKPKVTPGDVNLAFEIINFRYADPGLLTIISSELTTEDMLGVDEGVGSRIYQRAQGYNIPMTGKKNWRLEGGFK